MDAMKPLTAEEIAELRKLWAAPTGVWNALDAMACLTSVVPMVPRLLDLVERYRALLKRIEWGEADSDGGFSCRACDAYAWGSPPKAHAPGCELAALLAE